MVLHLISRHDVREDLETPALDPHSGLLYEHSAPPPVDPPFMQIFMFVYANENTSLAQSENTNTLTACVYICIVYSLPGSQGNRSLHMFHMGP